MATSWHTLCAMTTRRGIANKLDRIGALLAAATAELREPEPPRLGTTRSTAELVAAVEELTARIGCLEQAASQPPRAAYSLRELADRLGLSGGKDGLAGAQRLYRMVREGDLKAFTIGRTLHVPATELDRLLANEVHSIGC